ncbi:MAG: beta-glucosidase [Verrucomicrobia bacterium]|nr:beta-glucosidase [Verrucomicrobiota bacterium]
MSNGPVEPFVWGAATASYQIEGAAAEGGRAPSIWDAFARTPNKVERSETGDVACDHYHRFKEDVALMRDLRIQAYRFSISWSRVLPEGRGRQNAAGFDFYDRLVDELLAAGITPFATLFHWDLPQALQERGGFTSRDVAGWFSDYAVQTADRLGDRIRNWILLNEPSVYACLGHALGIHAPGVTDLRAFLAVTHHLNLAQGLALQGLRSTDSAWRLGTTMTIQRALPADASKASATMAERHNDLWNGCFLEPLFLGTYPDRVRAEFEPFIRPGDLQSIRQPVDFLGVNHYCRMYLRARPDAVLGYEHVSPPAHVPKTSFDWEINPQEFRDILLWLHDAYPCPPIYITENGAYFEDTSSEDGKVHDNRRIEFLDSYIHAMLEALSRGVDIRGYFVWSLMDNFEWACGYRPTFGIIKVDFATQRRIPKDSYYWYRDFIQRHRDVARSGGGGD